MPCTNPTCGQPECGCPTSPPPARRDFRNCDPCEMRGACRGLRRCAKTVTDQVDADVAAWRAAVHQHLSALSCVHEFAPEWKAAIVALPDLLDRVVAVRAAGEPQ